MPLGALAKANASGVFPPARILPEEPKIAPQPVPVVVAVEPAPVSYQVRYLVTAYVRSIPATKQSSYPVAPLFIVAA